MSLVNAAQSPRENPEGVILREASDSPSAGARNAKRPRKIASRACDACSKRKIRCNQASPKCASCEASGLRCEYTRPTNRRGRPSTITKEFMEEPREGYVAFEDVQDAHYEPPAMPNTTNNNEHAEHASDTNDNTTAANFMRLEQILAMPLAVPMGGQHAHAPTKTPSDSSYAPAVPTPATNPPRRPVLEAFGGISGAPSSGLDSALPWQAVCELIELFFSHLWPRMPIIHQPSFRQDMQNRKDRHSASWYMLALNTCAAAAIACRPMPMPDILGQLGYEWEGLARHLNSCLRQMGAWIHTMARASSLVCLQNVLLVHYFERCIGSPIADRLGSEAQRIAQAFHFNMEIPGIDAVEAEMRRRIYWSLYMQDKLDAILHRRTMSLRQDEIMVELPSIQLSEHIMNPAIDTSELLRPFLQRIQMCQAAEHILLRWREDARCLITAENTIHVRSHLHHSLERLIACSARLRLEQTDVASITNEISTLILETCLIIDGMLRAAAMFTEVTLYISVYHRYSSLLDDEKSNLGQRLCSVGSKAAIRLATLPLVALQLLQPTLSSMLELIYRRVQATVSSISDPLARHDAGEVEAALEGLVSAARPTYPSHTVDVNTASLTVSDRSQLPPQAFENAGLPSENVLPGDVPGVPMIFGQSGLGTLGFLNDLSTTNLQTADWFAFFDS